MTAHLPKGMLFGIAPRDPATFTIVTLLMIAVDLSACAAAAMRAARVDPLTAIRKE